MDKPDTGIETSLDKMAEAGDFDSSGEFTLASERAQSVMESSLLEDPRAYVLNLIAAGVAGGASSVNLYTDADDCIVSFDGSLPSREELQNLLQYGLADDVEVRLKELAIGVLGAQALQPRWVKIQVNDGERLLTLTLDSEQHLFEEESQAAAGVKIHMKEALSIRALWRALSRPEATIVGQRCQLSPVPIVVNGTTINDLMEPQIRLASAVVGAESDELWEDWSWRSRLPVQRVLSDKLRGAFFIYQNPEMEADTLRIVLNGVSFPCQESLGWDGCAAIIYCTDLQKDLSQSQIVRDQAYLQLVVDVQEQLNHLVGYLLESWSELKGRASQARLDLLDGVVRQARQDGDWNRAASTLQKVVTVQEALRGHTDTETQRCRLALVDCLLEAGQLETGLPLLLKEAKLCGELSRYQTYRELLLKTDSILLANPELNPGAQLEVLEGLAYCESRRGYGNDCSEILERLKAEYEKQEVNDWPARFQKVELECQVAVSKTAGTTSTSLCTRCNGPHLMSECEVVGRKWATIDVIAGHRNPDAALFTDPVRLPVQATVCGDCGHVEFSVSNPQSAWSEFLKAKNRGS